MMVEFNFYDTEKDEGVDEYFKLEEGSFCDAMYINSIHRSVYYRLNFNLDELIKDLYNNLDLGKKEFLKHIETLINE